MSAERGKPGRTRVAVDGMGGDRAPGAIVDGAVQAARSLDVEVILVGQKDRLAKELDKFRPLPPNLRIHHAPEVIKMAESPAVSVRRKPDSSICQMVELAKRGEADAIVSAGNTGAVVCAAGLGLGMLEGVDRPGIAVVVPSLRGPVMVIDMGANIDPKPGHLFQYGIMGSIYMNHVMGIDNPVVGLLNVGEEETKGTDFVRAVFKLLDESSLNFMGNAEGRDIFAGRCHVIVTDGFVGNVALKVSEGMAFALTELLRQEIRRTLWNKIGGAILYPAFQRLKKQMDYAQYGGAPLLGVKGACFICHGSSSAWAIRNAVARSAVYVTHNVNQAILDSANELRKAAFS
ncbi:MAG: phosphate acyltransferase PlsX [Candidatus Omnitrophica bacterium]|nr:phosphate acyltransferase PlsX [Candidatus Omnitrophota bacterium]